MTAPSMCPVIKCWLSMKFTAVIPGLLSKLLTRGSQVIASKTINPPSLNPKIIKSSEGAKTAMLRPF